MTERNVRRLKADLDDLREFVSEIAGDGCSYGDGCPDAARHYVCLPCKAMRALDRQKTRIRSKR